MISIPSVCLVVQAIATGSVAGSLRDATTNEPLRGAVVAVLDVNRTTVTDSAGRYRLDQLTPGPHALLIRRIGYTPRVLEALVPEGGTVEISIALHAEPVVLNAVEGTELALGPSTVPDRRVDMASVHNHPLLAEADAFQALSGGIVGVQPESPAGMHIRGGASDQVTYLLDGFPVFSPYHSGESFSAWNPDALADVQLQSTAEAWDALSGVVSANTRAPGSQHHIRTGVSSTQMRVTVDGPLGSGNAGYLWSERSGFAGFPMPQPDPTYLRGETGDRLVKLDVPFAGGRGRLVGYTDANELDTDAGLGSSEADRNTFNWQSTTLGAEWSRSIYAGEVRARIWEARADAGATWHPDSTVQHVASRRRDAGLSVSLARGHTTIDFRVQTSSTAYRTTVDSAAGVRFASQSPLAVVAIERAQAVGTRVGLVAAISAATSAGAGRVSPRATVHWTPARALVLSGGYQRLYQFSQSLRNPESVAGTMFPVDLLVGASRSGVPVARVDQGIVTASLQPAPGGALRLTTQGYVRRFEDIVLVAPTSRDPFATGDFAVGNGMARGVSIELTRATRRSTIFATYTAQYVQLSSDAVRYTPDYGAAHSVDGGVMLEASRHLSLRLGGSGRFGCAATAVTTPFEWESCNVTDRGCEFAGSPRSNSDSLGATRLPGYLRVDFGVHSRWSVRVAGRTSEIALFGTITNVFARSNVFTMAPPLVSPPQDASSGIRTPVTLRSRVPLVFGLDWTF